MNIDPKVVDTMIDQATEGDPGARRVIKAEVERLRADLAVRTGQLQASRAFVASLRSELDALKGGTP